MDRQSARRYIVVRFVIYGAGAVGGVIGARLFQADQNVVLIARGPHHDAIRDKGLRLICHDEDVTLPVPVVRHPSELTFTEYDVVVLAMKTQHTAAALIDLSAAAAVGPDLCRVRAERRGERAAGVALVRRRLCGVRDVSDRPSRAGRRRGVLLPRFGHARSRSLPDGARRSRSLHRHAIDTTTFQSIPRVDIMRWKYSKLITNLSNAANALCGSSPAHRADLGTRSRGGRAGVARREHRLHVAGRRRRAPGQPVADEALRAAAPIGEARRGRACAGAPGRSRPTISTARSPCSDAVWACRRPSTNCCNGCARSTPGSGCRRARSSPEDLLAQLVRLGTLLAKLAQSGVPMTVIDKARTWKVVEERLAVES